MQLLRNEASAVRKGPVGLLLAAAVLLTAGNASAHGETDWNEFKIDNKNDAVATQLAHARETISAVVLRRREVTEWPDLDLMRMRDRLDHLIEEMELLLAHFREDGILIQFTDVLHEHPRAGRSVAAVSALETCVALIDHIATLESPEAFETELHEGGESAYLFDLMDAYVDNMALYGKLLDHSH